VGAVMEPQRILDGITLDWNVVGIGALAAGKTLGSPVLITEGCVTLVYGILAIAVLAGLMLNAAAGWWWADPLAALFILVYALREAREIFLVSH